MFGISQKNGVKKHFFRPEKEHGFSPRFYSVHDTTISILQTDEELDDAKDEEEDAKEDAEDEADEAAEDDE